jgi:hypothetical protein
MSSSSESISGGLAAAVRAAAFVHAVEGPRERERERRRERERENGVERERENGVERERERTASVHAIEGPVKRACTDAAACS